MAKSKRRPQRAKHILPAPAAPVVLTPDNYLDGLRSDNMLDGLISTAPGGPTGGGWTNKVTGLGTFGRDKVMQGSYQEAFRISDVELSALYNGNDLAKRVVETVPKEMFRRGWVLVVPQDDEDEEAEPPQGKTALEQPAGGESGPAAPGSPLVDPMGADPANATAKVPQSQIGDKVAPDGSGLGASPDKSGAQVGGSQDEKIANGDPLGPPSPSGAARVAPAAPGAGAHPLEDPTKDPTAVHDPMGEQLAKGPHDQSGSGDAMTPTSMRKPAPPAPQTDEDGSGKIAGPNGDGPGGDQGKGADLAKDAEVYAARLNLKARFLEACIFGRLYGGGMLIFGADDGQDMALPLDETKIKTIRYLAWIDRRFAFASSWYSEIGPKYGEVRTWQIVNPFGGQSNTVVHESRVIRFDGAPVDFLMRRRLLGWTLSTLQAPYDTLRQFDTSFQAISNLMSDMSQAVMKINGLAQLISNDQATLQTRMQMVDISRSSARMLYIDAENEEFERTATPLTGVSDVIQMQMLRTAAAAGQPVAILFGREPSGLNATGDADFRRFYDQTAGEQKADLEPKLRRAYTLIFAAQDGPTAGKVPQNGLEFVWHKLYEPSEKEQAEIRWLMAQADDKYIDNGTLLPEEVAVSRFRSGDLHLDTEIDIELREESLATAELAPSGAAKAQQEADQAKDLAITSANAKGSNAGGKPFGGPPGKPGAAPAGKPGAKPPPGKAPAGKPPGGK